MNSYITAFLKKFDYYFEQKEITAIIFLIDSDEDEQLDQVLYLENEKNSVTGLFANGMNPLFSKNRLHELDDFNLFASYDFLTESREAFKLSIARVNVFFSTAYHECLGFYFTNKENTNALVILFLENEIHLQKVRSINEVQSILEKNGRKNFITYEKFDKNEWRQQHESYFKTNTND